MWHKKTTTYIKRPGDAKGSRRKLYQQKGSGRARAGFIRASHRVGGAKAFGPLPKDFTYYLPEKVKLQGLKAMLSAKLAEGSSLLIYSITYNYTVFLYINFQK